MADARIKDELGARNCAGEGTRALDRDQRIDRAPENKCRSPDVRQRCLGCDAVLTRQNRHQDVAMTWRPLEFRPARDECIGND